MAARGGSRMIRGWPVLTVRAPGKPMAYNAMPPEASMR
jgi:hypothetical protein